MRGLHGESRHYQTLAQSLGHIDVAREYGIGCRERFAKTVLHQIPREGVDRLRTDSVRYHPVGAGGYLGYKIGIARRGQLLGRFGGYGGVEDEAVGCWAVEGLLVAVERYRGAVGGVSVHRDCRAYAQCREQRCDTSFVRSFITPEPTATAIASVAESTSSSCST